MRAEIPYIDYLLSRWGRWAIRHESGGLGYAKCSILMGAHEGEGHYDPAPPPDVTEEDFNAVTNAVNKLPPIIRMSVIQVYQLGAGKSDRFNANELGITSRTLSQYIGQAQRTISLEISFKRGADARIYSD